MAARAQGEPFEASPSVLPGSSRPSSLRFMPSVASLATHSIPLPPTHDSGVVTSTPLRRPSLSRSVSSPIIQYSTVHPSSRKSPLPSAAHNRDREWSLFGQLMENEGQLRPSTSATSRLRRRNAQLRSSGTNAGFPSPGHTSPGDHAHPTSSSSSSELSALSTEPDPITGEPLRHLPVTDDYDSDNSDQSSDAHASQQAQERTTRRFAWLSLPPLPRLYKNVLKCALAYLIASLFTFVPYLSGFLADVPTVGKGEGPSPSGHMVATVCVWFISVRVGH